MFPTEGNRRLMVELSAINEALGRGPMQEADPTMGEGGHTPNESLDLTSLPLAIKRAAILIYRLTDDE
jgi:glutamate carboxypeptidase